MGFIPRTWVGGYMEAMLIPIKVCPEVVWYRGTSLIRKRTPPRTLVGP